MKAQAAALTNVKRTRPSSAPPRPSPPSPGQSHLKSLDLLGGPHHVEKEVVVPSGALDLAA
ncbi:MAG: hypothetical protein OXL38_06960, partial [Gammaproteobacteria bacterium]|nr:hypothetical protein [Gammaproteobacteria bacterium]